VVLISYSYYAIHIEWIWQTITLVSPRSLHVC